MAQLTLTSALTYTRLKAQDNDSSVGDSDLTTIINKWYHLWTDEIDPRVTIFVPTALLPAQGSPDGNGSSNYLPANSSYFTTKSAMADLLALFTVSTDASEIGTALERVSMADMLRFWSNDATSTGPTAYWALERIRTTTVADVGKFKVWIYPKLDFDSYVAAHGRKWITSVSGSNPMDVDDADAYRICDLAASELAWLLGKPSEFIQGILASLGDKGAVLARRWQTIVNTRVPRQKEAI